jgi:hypothetical protein
MINPTFTGFINLNGNTVLADIGKTIVSDGFIYRSVQITSYNGELILGGQTGYICLNSDEINIPDVGSENQGISRLN